MEKKSYLPIGTVVLLKEGKKRLMIYGRKQFVQSENKEYDYVLDELKQIIGLKKDYMKTKVLIELNCLEDNELEKACQIVIESGADFLKTGTGWVPGNANIDRIRTIKSIVGNKVKIKAAGGIRTRNEFDELLEIGVERFGINTRSAIEIIKTF